MNRKRPQKKISRNLSLYVGRKERTLPKLILFCVLPAPDFRLASVNSACPFKMSLGGLVSSLPPS